MSFLRSVEQIPDDDVEVPSRIVMRYCATAERHIITADGYPDFFVSTTGRNEAFVLTEAAISVYMSLKFDCHLTYLVDRFPEHPLSAPPRFTVSRGFPRRKKD